MKKLLFVYNARSGKARIKRYLSDIINILRVIRHSLSAMRRNRLQEEDSILT